MTRAIYDETVHIPKAQAFDTFEALCFNGKLVDVFLDKDQLGENIFCMVAEKIDNTGNIRFNLEIPDGFSLKELQQVEEDFKQR